MSLDMHAAATSVVAPQHLAAGSVRSERAASDQTETARAAVVAKAEDSVEVSTPEPPFRLPGQFRDMLQAIDASNTTAVKIIAMPDPAINAQAHSLPDQVYSLVA